MRRRPKIHRLNVQTLQRGNVGATQRVSLLVIAAVIAVMAMATAALAGPERSNVQTSKRSNVETKWDAGQKDLLASMEAESADQAKTEKSKESGEPVYVTLLSFIFKLALVVGLAYGTIWVLKRFNVQGLKRSSEHTIRVVENTTLAANRSLHLVEVGSKRLLVASTPGQISLLTEVESEQPAVEKKLADAAPSIVATGKDQTGKTACATTNFKDQLTSYLGARFLGTVGSASVDRSDDQMVRRSEDTAVLVAQQIRDTSAFLQDKVLVVARARKGLRDA